MLRCARNDGVHGFNLFGTVLTFRRSIATKAGRGFSRAYLRHLVKSGEILGMMALTAINLAYYQRLMDGARAAVAAGRLGDYVAETRAGWARGESAGA